MENKKGLTHVSVDAVIICQFVEKCLWIPRETIIAMLLADGITVGVDTVFFQWRYYITEKAHEFLRNS